MSVLLIENVRKVYDGHVAVKEINLNVPKGIIFGLLGPNGAGKTTLIRMITGITEPDQGRILLNGEEVTGILNRDIGYLPEERGLYKKMKVADQLVYLARLKGLSAVEAKRRIKLWLKKFDMMSWRHRQIDELSKGMQQKIQFIATVVHEPSLLILDEPFSGLDPVNTNLIKNEIKALRNQGKSIIFSTHRMEQVEEICEEIALVNNGQNILSGHVHDIKHSYKQNQFLIKYHGDMTIDWPPSVHIVASAKGESKVQLSEDGSPGDLLRSLLKQGVEIQHFEEVLPSLNEVFIKTVAQ